MTDNIPHNKQTFAIELDNVAGAYEFNMLTEEANISQEDVIEYFCKTHGFTPQFVNEHLKSLFRVVKEFIPLET